MTQATDDYPYDFDRPELVEFVPRGMTRILDVGCSTGRFARLLKQREPQLEVWGVEPNAEAAGQAASELDRVFPGFFPDALPADAGHFDALIFNDVLEHMPEPWAVLAGAATLLSSNGVVIASIPNIRYWPVLGSLLLHGDFTYTPTGVLDRTHLRFFTYKTMHHLFEGAGFQVLSCAPININRSERKLRVLQRLVPKLGNDLSAMQYVLVAKRVAS